MPALDGDGVVSASAPPTEISARYAQAVLPLADALVASFPEAGLTLTPTLYWMLQLIDDAFLAFPRIEEDRKDAYFDAFNTFDGLLATLIGSGELMGLIASVNTSEAGMIERNLCKPLKAIPDIDSPAMRNLYEACQSDLARRDAALDRYNARPSPSKAMRPIWRSIARWPKRSGSAVPSWPRFWRGPRLRRYWALCSEVGPNLGWTGLVAPKNNPRSPTALIAIRATITPS